MLELMKWFESVETDAPFVTCKVCTHPLVFSESWVVNKHYHRDECVMEYAVCEECRDGVSGKFSEESKAAIREFLESKIDWEQRMLDWMALENPEKRLDNCVACSTQRGLADGYAISAQFRQDESLIEGALPLLMCSDCVAKITASLSPESREVWRDFVARHFDGPGTDDVDLGIF